MNSPNSRVAYIDVDDTLVRTVGAKQIPIASVVAYVRRLHSEGARLYCWSSGGAAYAEEVASKLGLEACFEAFLPKPNLLLDDQAPADWRYCETLHPLNVPSDG